VPGRTPAPGFARSKIGVELRPGAVKEARNNRELTLAQLGGTSLTRSAIHRIETGRSKPSMKTLVLLAERTGKPISFFLPIPSQLAASQFELERLTAETRFDEVLKRGSQILEAGGLDGHPEALVHYWMGEANVRLIRPEPAIGHLDRALRLFDDHADPWMAAHALHMKSSALYLLDDPESQPAAEAALRLCRELSPAPPMLEARILNHLAAIAVNRQEWQQAIRLYDRALSAAEPLRDLRQLSLMYEGLGMASHHLGRLTQANEYFSKALSLYALQSDMASMSRAEVNLSELLIQAGQLEAAEEHLERSLRYCHEHGVDRRNRSYTTVNLARLRQRQGRMVEAESLARQTIELASEGGELLSLATALQVLAGLLVPGGHRQEADACYEEAVGTYRALGLVGRVRACLIEHAEQLDLQGRSREAKSRWRAAALAGAGPGESQGEKLIAFR